MCPQLVPGLCVPANRDPAPLMGCGFWAQRARTPRCREAKEPASAPRGPGSSLDSQSSAPMTTLQEKLWGSWGEGEAGTGRDLIPTPLQGASHTVGAY